MKPPFRYQIHSLSHCVNSQHSSVKLSLIIILVEYFTNYFWLSKPFKILAALPRIDIIMPNHNRDIR